jgi:argininosuccinate lyase
MPRAHELLFLLLRTVEAIVVDPQRSLAEVTGDYSAMTNVAEVLVKSSGVPFREAHEFASRLTDFGRQRRLKPAEIGYADAVSIYGGPLPLSEAELAQALDPRQIIATRRGRGGPQPDETRRMLSEAGDAIRAHREWLAERRQAVAGAREALDAAFGTYMKGA